MAWPQIELSSACLYPAVGEVRDVTADDVDVIRFVGFRRGRRRPGVGSFQNIAERQIDPWTARLRLLVDAMRPVYLSDALHQQDAA